MSDPNAPPDTLEDPLVGVVLDGRYHIERVVGVGGFGRVYRAQQTNIGRAVAIKVLSLDAAQRADQVRRFQTEASIISRLRHPNTLKLIDSGRTPDGRLYIATEFLTGAPLDVVLRARPLEPIRTLQLLRQVCGSLAEAHEAGVVHRDLKPANIFVEPVGGQEVAKVLDFGVAKLTQQSTETASGTIFGTPTYMSPEQAAGEVIDARSDIYALGVIAYEMLTGRPPFRGSTPMSLLLKHIQEQPTPPSTVLPGLISPSVEAFVMRLLAKSPTQRPSTANEVRQLIDQLLMQLSGPSRPPPRALIKPVAYTPTVEASEVSEEARDMSFDATASAAMVTPAALLAARAEAQAPADAVIEEAPAAESGHAPRWALGLLLLSFSALGAFVLYGNGAGGDVPDAGLLDARPILAAVVDAAPPPVVDATVVAVVVDAAVVALVVDADVPDMVAAVACKWIWVKKQVFNADLQIYETKRTRKKVCKKP